MRKLLVWALVSLAVAVSACNQNVTPPPPPPDTEFGRGLEFTPRETYLGVPQYQPTLTFGAGQLPDRVDLAESGRFPTPGQQGAQQSCTGWATAYAMKTYQEAVEGNYPPTSTNQVFSPAFPYYFTNRAAGDAQNCVGAAVTTMKTVLDLLQTRGCATLATMPYNESICAQAPSEAALNEARNYTIRNYRRVESLDEIRKVISEGQPVVIGIVVGSVYMQAAGDQWTRDGYLADLNDTNAGGHAFLIVGYDDNARTLKVMNSWGTGWGDGGFWDVSYDVIEQAITLVNQGQTLLELWLAEDNVSDAAYEPDPTPVEDPETPPATSDQITLSNVEFLVDAQDDQGQLGLGVTFSIALASALQGDEITCVLLVADNDTGELLPDRDGQYAYDGYVAQWGSIYVGGELSLDAVGMVLPYGAFDLDAGDYSLVPVLYAGNSDSTQVTAVAADGSFPLTVEQAQVNSRIPVGDYYGLDSDEWWVDFFVEGDGMVYAGLTNPDPEDPFFFFAEQAGITQDGNVYLQFVLTGFADEPTCEYLGGFTDADGGEGIWECDNGWNGTWTFINFTAFYDFEDYDYYEDFDDSYDYFDEWDDVDVYDEYDDWEDWDSWDDWDAWDDSWEDDYWEDDWDEEYWDETP
jgi:hypothetical protein